MDLFAEEGLKFFGIDKKVKESGSTEIVVLDAPIDNKNSGITLYTILVDVSVKKLVSPV